MLIKLVSISCLFIGLTCAVRKVTVQPFYNIKGTMIGVIGLGSPMQPTTMELNPSTPDFFVIPTDCKTEGCNKNRKGFDTSKSTTFIDNGRKTPFSVKYMGVKSDGILAGDSLTALAIPGKAPPAIPLPLIQEPHGPLVSGYATGLMGQGFLPANSKQPATFLQNLVKNLDSPAFEIYLQSYKHTKEKDISTFGNVTYGGRDIEHCKHDGSFFDTDYKREWAVKLDRVRIGATKLRGGKALFYHGSPRIHAPMHVVAAIRKRIHAQYDSNLKEYYVSCSKKKRLPRLYLIIQGIRITLYPREYLVQSEGTNKCLLMIAGPSPRYKGGEWILGDPIFREHCIYYDFNGPRIGITKHK